MTLKKPELPLTVLAGTQNRFDIRIPLKEFARRADIPFKYAQRLVRLGDLKLDSNGKIITSQKELEDKLINSNNVTVLLSDFEQILGKEASKNIEIVIVDPPQKRRFEELKRNNESMPKEEYFQMTEFYEKRVQYLLREIPRFLPHLKPDPIMIPATLKDSGSRAGVDRTLYSKADILELIRKFGETDDDIIRICRQLNWATEFVQHTDTYVDNAVGLTLGEAASILGLSNSSTNRRRLWQYCEDNYLSYEDFGVIPSKLAILHFSREDEYNKIYEGAKNLWFQYYTDLEEFAYLSKVKNWNKLTTSKLLSKKGFDRRTNEKNISDFIRSEGILPQTTFADTVFDGLREYLEHQEETITLDKLLFREIQLYNKAASIQFLEPMRVESRLLYHASDTKIFKKILQKSEILDKVRMGISIKNARRTYSKKGNINGMLSTEKLAEILSTSVERVSSLKLDWLDRGLLWDVSKRQGHKYGVLREFYDAHLKGYAGAEIFDMRIKSSQRALLKVIKAKIQAGELVEPKIDPADIDKELKRQYDIDGREGKYMLAAFKPIRLKDKSYIVKGDDEKINQFLDNNLELKIRTQWSSVLREFYRSTKNDKDYVNITDYQKELGMGDADFARLRNRLSILNPALSVLDTRIKMGTAQRSQKFIPREFDKAYFSDEDKEYILREDADRLKSDFKRPNEVSSVLLGMDTELATLTAELGRLGTDLAREFADVLKSDSKRPDEVLTVLLGMYTDLAVLTAEPERFGAKLTEELGPYYLKKSKGSGQERYLRQDIKQLQAKLSKLNIYDNLRTAIAIGKTLPEAKTSEIPVDRKQAAASLSISADRLDELIEAGKIQTRDFGLAPILSDIIREKYGIDVTSERILDYVQADTRYHEKIFKREGVIGIDDFKANCFDYWDTKELVAGHSWLGTDLFEYYVLQAQPIIMASGDSYLVHITDLETLEDYQSQDSTLDVAISAVAKHLGLEKLPEKYQQMLQIQGPFSVDKVDEIANAVEEFQEECKPWEAAELPGKFTNQLIFDKVLKVAVPDAVEFLNGYHTDDVAKMKEFLENSASPLGLSTSNLIYYINYGYIQLCRSGVEQESVRKLSENSSLIADIEKVSSNLAASLQEIAFTFNGKKYCPMHELRTSLKEGIPDNVKQDGMGKLLRWSKPQWMEYIKQTYSTNGNPGEEADKVAKYLVKELKSIHPHREKKTYHNTEIYEDLVEFAQLLMDNNVGRMTRFQTKQRQRTSWNGDIKSVIGVDADKNYYTLREAQAILGKNPNKYRDLGLSPLRVEDKLELYSIQDLAKIASLEKHYIGEYLADPLEKLVVYASMRNGADNCSDSNPKIAAALKIEHKVCQILYDVAWESLSFGLCREALNPDKVAAMEGHQLRDMARRLMQKKFGHD